jgi:hypothetical protein
MNGMAFGGVTSRARAWTLYHRSHKSRRRHKKTEGAAPEGVVAFRCCYHNTEKVFLRVEFGGVGGLF